MTLDVTVNGRFSPDGMYLAISPEVWFILDPEYYRQKEYGEPGLMPQDIAFVSDTAGIEPFVTEELGVEKFGNLTMTTRDGKIGTVEFGYVCGMSRRENTYVLRQAPYKKDELFALYWQQNGASPIGLAELNFEEEGVAKLMGIGIRDEFQRQGHGTVFLAALEQYCRPTNAFMIVHDPLKQEIPFYVANGYRHLVHPLGPDFAKVLNPGFDEELLMPRKAG